jgi:hypothetical protein
MTAKEALELTKEAKNKTQQALIAAAEPILTEVYERIKTAAEHEKTKVILGGENDRSDVGRKIAQLGVTGMPYTQVGSYVASVLEQQGYKVHADGYGVHIDWTHADKPVSRGGMPDS